MDPASYDRFVSSPFAAEHLAERGEPPLLVVGGARNQVPGAISPPGSLPAIVAWLSPATGGNGPPEADLAVDEVGLVRLRAVAGNCPIAAVTLALVLRATDRTDIDTALAIESAAYSVLQAGPEFATWRATHRPHSPATPQEATGRGGAVTVLRDGDALKIILSRPDKHNAISSAMRDELDAALAVAEADDSIRSVLLSGVGPSFCSGGDLDEFGSRPDPATAHLTRLARSPARRLARIADRTTASVHGATMGGGIELAAFASRVVAHPDVQIALPEVGLGLIPGAGGTVSIPRRMGRQRTAALCLALESIGAPTALDWGLVDSVADAP